MTSRTAFLLLLTAVVVAGMSLWQLEPRVARLWANTALLAAGAGLIALPLGTAAAIVLCKTDAPTRRAATLVLVGMLFVPLYLVAGAWDAGFGLQGWHTLTARSAAEPWLSGWRAVIWIHALAAVPWVTLIVGAGLTSAEAEIEEDAATCTGPLRVLWHITLRRADAALIVAVVWVAVVASAEISATDLFQVRTFAEEVYTQAALGTFDFAEPVVGEDVAIGAVGLWSGLLLSTLLAVIAIVAAGRLFVDLADPPQRPPWRWRLRRGRWAAVAVLWSILLLVAGVPLANLVYKAGMRATITDAGPVRSWSAAKALERLAAAPAEFRGELWLSTRIGLGAATAAVAVAIPLAWSMRRARRLPRGRLALLALCLTIPGPLLGVSLIRLLNQPPDSPLWLLATLYDTNFAPWLVQTLRAVPLATLILWPALASVPQAMLDAAATEGSGWWGQLWRIALPQRWPALAAAWLVGLAIAVGELAGTVLVIPPQQSTAVSVRVFQLLHFGVDDRLAAISLLMVAGVAALTASAALLVRRRFGQPAGPFGDDKVVIE